MKFIKKIFVSFVLCFSFLLSACSSNSGSDSASVPEHTNVPLVRDLGYSLDFFTGSDDEGSVVEAAVEMLIWANDEELYEKSADDLSKDVKNWYDGLDDEKKKAFKKNYKKIFKFAKKLVKTKDAEKKLEDVLNKGGVYLQGIGVSKNEHAKDNLKAIEKAVKSLDL